MENATKALLIAAAVLIAILIISLGLVVYNMASETIGAVDFSSQEVTAFNDKFTQYEGSNVRGSQVNALLKTVMQSNMQSRAEGLVAGTDAKFVSVTGAVTLAATATNLGGVEASTAQTYTVVANYDANTGFINNVTVTPTTP